jgi:hypothetical protein
MNTTSLMGRLAQPLRDAKDKDKYDSDADETEPLISGERREILSTAEASSFDILSRRLNDMPASLCSGEYNKLALSIEGDEFQSFSVEEVTKRDLRKSWYQVFTAPTLFFGRVCRRLELRRARQNMIVDPTEETVAEIIKIRKTYNAVTNMIEQKYGLDTAAEVYRRILHRYQKKAKPLTHTRGAKLLRATEDAAARAQLQRLPKRTTVNIKNASKASLADLAKEKYLCVQGIIRSLNRVRQEVLADEVKTQIADLIGKLDRMTAIERAAAREDLAYSQVKMDREKERQSLGRYVTTRYLAVRRMAPAVDRKVLDQISLEDLKYGAADLRRWELETAPGENRQEAVKRIRQIFAGGFAGQLHLNGLGLTSLPDVFAALPYLGSLDLTGNPLRELPESLGASPRLVQLSLSTKDLNSLPETIVDGALDRVPYVLLDGQKGNGLVMSKRLEAILAEKYSSSKGYSSGWYR